MVRFESILISGPLLGGLISDVWWSMSLGHLVQISSHASVLPCQSTTVGLRYYVPSL